MTCVSDILFSKMASVAMIKKGIADKFDKIVEWFYKNIIKASLFVCLLACTFTWGGADLQKYGPFNVALNSARIFKCNHDRNLNLDVSEIKVHIFDFSKNLNSSYLINDAAKGILDIASLDKTRQFIMFVGGFTSHINHAVEKQMRDAYKTHPNSYLIIPDHSAYTNNHNGNFKGYQRSVTYVHYIGKALGKMLADVAHGGVNTKNIHCVGHSLGGQILGHVGTTFHSETGDKIAKITALDPAGPCFTSSSIENQVRSGVADYVEVYHCNSGALGSASILGDVDFIMNRKGEAQPQCGMPLLPLIYKSSKAASCNHRICVDLWTASVKNPSMFFAYKCDSYKKFKAGKCATNEKTELGPANPGKAFGEYYLSTERYNLKALM